MLQQFRAASMVVLLTILTMAGSAAAQESERDDDTSARKATIVEAARKVIHAVGTTNLEKLTELTGGMAERDRMMFQEISAWSFHIKRAWIEDDNANVEYEWLACFDHEAFASQTLPDLRTAWRDAGEDQETRSAEYVAYLARLRALIEATNQILVLRRTGTNGWMATTRVFANPAPTSGTSVELDHSREILHRPEETCGGETPELAAMRVINAWKTHNIVDAILTAQPGEARRRYAQTDKSILQAIAIRSFRLERVWIRGDLAWVEYHWTTRFQDEEYARYLWDQELSAPSAPETDADKRMAMGRILNTVRLLKQTVEAETHFIRLKRHGTRWYNFGDPLSQQEPAFAPTRTAE